VNLNKVSKRPVKLANPLPDLIRAEKANVQKYPNWDAPLIAREAASRLDSTRSVDTWTLCLGLAQEKE
jgi:hypothetical protein